MMIFALPNLPWSPTDHLELFAGQRAVTSGEIEEWAVGKETTHNHNNCDVWFGKHLKISYIFEKIPIMDLIFLIAGMRMVVDENHRPRKIYDQHQARPT